MAQKTHSFWLRWDWRPRASVPLFSRAVTDPSEEELLATLLPEDRRNAVRHPCGLGISCQPIALVRIAPLPAVIQDVSATGIALVLDHPLPAGTFVVLKLPLAGGLKPIRARVVSARPQPDGGWVLGCNLDRKLRPNELRRLI